MAKAAVAESGSDASERILEAALETFSEMGFEGATTREIASRAGVTLGLLQYYFGAKPKLWRAAVDRAFEDLRGGLDAVLGGAAPGGERERIRRMIHAHVRFVARRPEFVRLMHDEGKRRGARMRWMVDRHVKPLYESILPMIENAQRQGILPADIAPVHFVYILIGAVDVIFHQAEECKRLTGVDPTEEAAVESHARAVAHFFLGAEEAKR
jgi:TetR/AcrR family transcriptional regulator